MVDSGAICSSNHNSKCYLYCMSLKVNSQVSNMVRAIHVLQFDCEQVRSNIPTNITEITIIDVKITIFATNLSREDQGTEAQWSLLRSAVEMRN